MTSQIYINKQFNFELKLFFFSLNLIPNAVISIYPLRSTDDSLTLKGITNIPSAKDPCVPACIKCKWF